MSKFLEEMNIELLDKITTTLSSLRSKLQNEYEPVYNILDYDGTCAKREEDELYDNVESSFINLLYRIRELRSVSEDSLNGCHIEEG